MNVLTTQEMEIVLDALNAIRRKDGMSAMHLRDLQAFLGALHTVELVIIKRGTLLQFTTSLPEEVRLTELGCFPH